MKQRSHVDTDEISFFSLVRDCAGEPQLVASFNQAYDANLQAPIAALLEDRWPDNVSQEEEIQIGYFILFIHEHIWQRLKCAQQRMGVSKRRIRQARVQRHRMERPGDFSRQN